jgi:hypothetical protein
MSIMSLYKKKKMFKVHTCFDGVFREGVFLDVKETSSAGKY